MTIFFFRKSNVEKLHIKRLFLVTWFSHLKFYQSYILKKTSQKRVDPLPLIFLINCFHFCGSSAKIPKSPQILEKFDSEDSSGINPPRSAHLVVGNKDEGLAE